MLCFSCYLGFVGVDYFELFERVGFVFDCYLVA